jgi:hypothetical protein
MHLLIVFVIPLAIVIGVPVLCYRIGRKVGDATGYARGYKEGHQSGKPVSGSTFDAGQF